MSNIATNTISVNVPVETKSKASAILGDLGLNMSTAINMFLVQVVENEGIPFEIRKSSDVYVSNLAKAIKEAEDIRCGRTRVKGYHNVHEMFKEVLDEPES